MIIDLYEVKSGDTLWSIAEKYYGDPSLWELIYRENQREIDNPDLIYPGAVLKIPANERRPA